MPDILLPFMASSLLQYSDIKGSQDKWSGGVQFNAAAATGNTDNLVLGGRFNIARSYGAITHAFDSGGNYTEVTRIQNGNESRDVTQNRWFTQYRFEIETGERTFFYGRARYEEDQFSGFDRQAFLGGGFGHTFYDREARKLSVLVGPGVQYLQRAEPDPVPDDFTRQDTTFAVFIGENFEQVLRENVTFEQSFDATVAENNNTVAARAALRTNLTDKISSRLSYAVTHNTNPPGNRENTDTLLSASIGYDF